MIILYYKEKVMHKLVLKGLLLGLFMGQCELQAKDCLDLSYESAKVNKTDRTKDLDYSKCQSKNPGACCCTSNIIELFKDKTEDITRKRVNPAVDTLIKALKNQRLASDIKIEELVHLKYVNTIYSFYDKDGEKMKNKKLNMPKDDDDGCEEEIKFRELTTEEKNRQGVYREGLLNDVLAMLHAWEKSDKMIRNKNMVKIGQ